MKEFDIEYQYKQFLVMMKLDESRMNDVEKKQRKMTFVAGFTQAFALFTEGITKVDENKGEDEAVLLIDSMKHDIEAYWNQEHRNHKNK